LVEKQIEAISQQKGIDIEAAARELLAEKQPSLQFVTPEQLGGAAVFLSSPAADQMTGTTLSLDGGWTAR
jgi:3-hydroxybutyrate dehydrogenase